MQPEIEKLEQLREDAKQAREVASKTREYARVGDWRREAWEADTEWFDRLASAAEDLAALREGLVAILRKHNPIGYGWGAETDAIRSDELTALLPEGQPAKGEGGT